MRRTFIAAITLLALTSCQTEQRPLPTELPFATHPSVLRGDWSGTILNVPSSQDMAIELTGIVPECSGRDGDICYAYIFEGQVRVGGSAPVQIRGDGFSGGNHLYTLTSPPRPLGVNASFELDGETWDLYADYSPRDAQPNDVAPSFEGDIYTSERNSRFRLEPAP